MVNNVGRLGAGVSPLGHDDMKTETRQFHNMREYLPNMNDLSIRLGLGLNIYLATFKDRDK